jgi:hypothetical protein
MKIRACMGATVAVYSTLKTSAGSPDELARAMNDLPHGC